MFARASLIVTGLAVTAFLAGCQRTEPADSAPETPAAVEQATAAPTETAAAIPAVEQAAVQNPVSEPGRVVCGAVSLVLPEGSTVDARDTDATVSLADGVTMEVTVIGDAATIGGDDAALQAQVQQWLDGLGPRMADEWTAEIAPVEGDGVRGYYAVAKSELSGQPGKAFAINGFYVIDGRIVAIGAVHDDASGAVNERVIGIVRTAEWAGS